MDAYPRIAVYGSRRGGPDDLVDYEMVQVKRRASISTSREKPSCRST